MSEQIVDPIFDKIIVNGPIAPGRLKEQQGPPSGGPQRLGVTAYITDISRQVAQRRKCAEHHST